MPYILDPASERTRHRTPTLSTVLGLKLKELPFCLFGRVVSLSNSPHWVSLSYHSSKAGVTLVPGPAKDQTDSEIRKKNPLAEPQGQEGRSHPPNARPAIFMATEAPPKVPCIYRALNLEAQSMKYQQRRGPHRRWELRGKVGRDRGGGGWAGRTENWWASRLKGLSIHSTTLTR